MLALVAAACASGRGPTPPAGVAVAPSQVDVASPPVAPPTPAAAPEAPPRVAESRVTSAIDLPAPSTVRVRVTDGRGTRILTLPLDEYVLGAVRAELPRRPQRDDTVTRVLQVQAVVSRTYALANLHRHEAEGFDLCDSTHCQAYRPRLPTESDSDLAARAVRATRDQIITHQGRVIQALFHADCGGHTTSAESVWGGSDAPYLRPVPDFFCTRKTARPWTFSTDGTSLRRALNSDARTEIGPRLSRIEVIDRDLSGRAILVALAGAQSPTVRAEEFRTVVRRVFGPRSIRSTWFNVTRHGQRFVFTGVGYGHGVGLCQAGALQRAKAGQSPADIIAHYFPSTRVQPASTAMLAPSPALRHLGH